MNNFQKYKYFKVIPIWKDNSRPKRIGDCPGDFVGDTSILDKVFGTIESALFAMKEDGTCLREKNWEIVGYYGWFGWHNIPLAELHRLGYLAEKVEKDSHSEYYRFKD